MNEVRLIDANALKYKNLAEVNGRLTYVLTADEINNAPTVEPEKVLFANVTFDEDKLKEIVHTEAIDKIKRGELVVKTEETPQGKFTDLERKVIADSINYLLGAELLEENGYTEEVVNALKSVLQKIGAEENHL